MMEGFGVHTFRLVNAAGEAVFVKFHWRPMAGTCSRWCGTRRSRSTAPTPTSTAATCGSRSRPGQFPEWELAVQVFTEAQADEFPSTSSTRPS
jgi:catalase